MSEENWHDYEMPEEVKAEFTKERLSYFLEELEAAFDYGHPFTYWESIVYIEGTVGWYRAFKKMCINYGLEDILAYYDKLEWYDSDIFDGELGDLLLEYKVVEEGEKNRV